MITQIKKIGFEIECESDYDTQEKLQGWGSIGSDGSIHRCSSHKSKYRDMAVCEFRSKVFNVENIDEKKGPKGLFEMLAKQEGDGRFHWNETMGFHVHVSFTNDGRPPEMFSGEFVEFFLNRMKKAFPEVYEKRKDNYYCKAAYLLDNIIQPHDRYRAVNYCSWSEFETIEFRIFASTDPKEMWEELNFVVDTINAFLSTPFKKSWTVKLRNPYSKKLNEKATTKEYVVTLPTVTVSGTDNYIIRDVIADGTKINKYL